MLHTHRITLPLLVLAGSFSACGELKPFHQVIVQAKSENKPIIVVWNGSDWSKNAQAVTRLIDQESQRSNLSVLWAVHDDKETLTEAEQEERKNKSPSVNAWNIPAIQVFTPENELIASAENISTSDVKKILATIPKVLETEKRAQELWKKAEEKSGVESIRIYDQGLALLSPVARKNRKSILDKVKKLDTDDKAGVLFKSNFNHQPYMEKLNSLCGEKKWEEAEKLLKEKLAIKGMAPCDYQKVMAGAFSLARNKGEKEKALQVLLEIVKYAPETEMGKGAKNYYDFLTKPILLKGKKISPYDMRPDFLPMVVNVGDVVKGAGTYQIEFKINDGGMSIRNARFVSGSKILAELPESEKSQEKHSFTLDLQNSPGSRVQLVVDTKGHGWFEASGEIIITKQ